MTERFRAIPAFSGSSTGAFLQKIFGQWTIIKQDKSNFAALRKMSGSFACSPRSAVSKASRPPDTPRRQKQRRTVRKATRQSGPPDDVR